MIRRTLFTNLDYQNAANKPSSWDPKNRQLYSICVKFYRFKFPHVWFLLRNHIKICVSSLIDLFSIYQAKETVEIRNSNLKNNASIWNWTLKNACTDLVIQYSSSSSMRDLFPLASTIWSDGVSYQWTYFSCRFYRIERKERRELFLIFVSALSLLTILLPPQSSCIGDRQFQLVFLYTEFIKTGVRKLCNFRKSGAFFSRDSGLWTFLSVTQ